MSTTSRENSDDPIGTIIAEYIATVQRDGPQNREQWLARYPDVASQLSSFFDDSDRCSKSPDPTVTYHQEPSPTANYDGAAARRTPIAHDVLPGHLLDGKYRVLATKQGGMGRVYFVTGKEDQDDEPKAALKTVIPFNLWRAGFPEISESELAGRYAHLLHRFRREAMNWVRLEEHANIISAVGVFEIAARPHLFLTYADSGDLTEWIRSAKLTIPLAVDFALQFCSGMVHAVESAGLVHRDIKPANVLVHQDRQIKITDLGLARAFAADDSFVKVGDSPQDDLSTPGGGSRPYMAPEQAESLRDADTRSDIFSFGVTLFEMLTRKKLFAKTNAYLAARKRLVLPAAHDVNASVPVSLSAVVARCVAYDREQRFGSFAELARALLSTGLAEGWSMERVRSHTPANSLPQRRDWNREVFALLSLGQFEEAAKLGQEAIDDEPARPGHWLNQGKACAELGQFSDAHRCYLQASELAPGNVECWFNLAYVSVSLGQPGDGLRMAERALNVDANCSQAWDAAGMCHHELKDTSESRRCFHRAVDADPHNWRAWSNLGQCLTDLGKHDEAIVALRRAVGINPEGAQAWFQIASILAMSQQYVDAFEAIELAVQHGDQHAASWGMRGVILTQLGSSHENLKNAADSFRRALALNPDIAMAAQLLRQVESQLGQ